MNNLTIPIVLMINRVLVRGLTVTWRNRVPEPVGNDGTPWADEHWRIVHTEVGHEVIKQTEIAQARPIRTKRLVRQNNTLFCYCDYLKPDGAVLQTLPIVIDAGGKYQSGVGLTVNDTLYLEHGNDGEVARWTEYSEPIVATFRTWESEWLQEERIEDTEDYVRVRYVLTYKAKELLGVAV